MHLHGRCTENRAEWLRICAHVDRSHGFAISLRVSAPHLGLHSVISTGADGFPLRSLAERRPRSGETAAIPVHHAVDATSTARFTEGFSPPVTGTNLRLFRQVLHRQPRLLPHQEAS